MIQRVESSRRFDGERAPKAPFNSLLFRQRGVNSDRSRRQEFTQQVEFRYSTLPGKIADLSNL